MSAADEREAKARLGTWLTESWERSWDYVPDGGYPITLPLSGGGTVLLYWSPELRDMGRALAAAHGDTLADAILAALEQAQQ
jgi:hypothetical protein